jgi:hypothetical protein
MCGIFSTADRFVYELVTRVWYNDTEILLLNNTNSKCSRWDVIAHIFYEKVIISVTF